MAQQPNLTPTDSVKAVTYIMPTKDNYLKLANEMETTLRRDVLGVWFPRAIDHEDGGFYSNFTREWQRAKSDGKFSVFQGRMTWLAAQIDEASRLEGSISAGGLARHGLSQQRHVG